MTNLTQMLPKAHTSMEARCVLDKHQEKPEGIGAPRKRSLTVP